MLFIQKLLFKDRLNKFPDTQKILLFEIISEELFGDDAMEKARSWKKKKTMGLDVTFEMVFEYDTMDEFHTQILAKINELKNMFDEPIEIK